MVLIGLSHKWISSSLVEFFKLPRVLEIFQPHPLILYMGRLRTQRWEMTWPSLPSQCVSTAVKRQKWQCLFLSIPHLVFSSASKPREVYSCHGCRTNCSKTLWHKAITCYAHRFCGLGIQQCTVRMASSCSMMFRNSAGRAKALSSSEVSFIHMSRGWCCQSVETCYRLVHLYVASPCGLGSLTNMVGGVPKEKLRDAGKEER